MAKKSTRGDVKGKAARPPLRPWERRSHPAGVFVLRTKPGIHDTPADADEQRPALLEALAELERSFELVAKAACSERDLAVARILRATRLLAAQEGDAIFDLAEPARVRLERADCDFVAPGSEVQRMRALVREIAPQLPMGEQRRCPSPGEEFVFDTWFRAAGNFTSAIQQTFDVLAIRVAHEMSPDVCMRTDDIASAMAKKASVTSNRHLVIRAGLAKAGLPPAWIDDVFQRID